MEALIKAYLNHIDHYLKDSEILEVDEAFDERGNVFKVTLNNECYYIQHEVIGVRCADLMSFMWSKVSGDES